MALATRVEHYTFVDALRRVNGGKQRVSQRELALFQREVHLSCLLCNDRLAPGEEVSWGVLDDPDSEHEPRHGFFHARCRSMRHVEIVSSLDDHLDVVAEHLRAALPQEALRVVHPPTPSPSPVRNDTPFSGQRPRLVKKRPNYRHA